MKPIIGITASIKDNGLTFLKNDYCKAISMSSGVPVILPILLKREEVNAVATAIDGLLLTGGGDIDPTLFGEEPIPGLGNVSPKRDYFEVELIKEILSMSKPILAICHGCQILNIAIGGDMYQDIYTQKDKRLLQHSQNAPRNHASHFVHAKKESLLFEITKKERFKVNSFHHQAVRKIGSGFEVSATANDGVIEAFESYQHRFVLNLQWHPECMIEDGNDQSIAIFEAFVNACKDENRE